MVHSNTPRPYARWHPSGHAVSDYAMGDCFRCDRAGLQVNRFGEITGPEGETPYTPVTRASNACLPCTRAHTRTQSAATCDPNDPRHGRDSDQETPAGTGPCTTLQRRERHMKTTVQRWATVQGGEDNTDIEDGDGGGPNPGSGCGDNGGK